MKKHSAPEIVKRIAFAVLLMFLGSTLVAGALGQTPSKILTLEEQELIKAQKGNEEAQAEYYREQTNKLRQPPLAASPTPGKTFRQSVAENPASVVGVIGTILGAIIVALVSLTTLYFNSRNAIKAQRDSQFYEAMKRMGDKDSPTLRASAAGLLALMARQEWREPTLTKKWPFLQVEKSRPYFETAVNQLLVGHQLESNRVGTESIKNALQQLVPLIPQNIGAITHELHAANLSIQDVVASLVAEFFAISGCDSPYADDEQSIDLWRQLESSTSFDMRSLRKLVSHNRSYANRFWSYRFIIDAQNAGDRGQLLSAIHDKLQVASANLRANITLFCTALGQLQQKDTPEQSHYWCPFRFKRAFLVDGEIGHGANLSNLDFEYGNFSGMHLHNVNLANTNLNGATLNMWMDGGSLRNAQLSWAEFDGDNIRGVDMTDALLAKARIPAGLSSAWLKADFTHADKIDNKLLESLFKNDSQLVPTDLNEVHASVRTFLESKQEKSKQDTVCS